MLSDSPDFFSKRGTISLKAKFKSEAAAIVISAALVGFVQRITARAIPQTHPKYIFRLIFFLFRPEEFHEQQRFYSVLRIITSVAFTSAVAVSPTLSPNASKASRVITDVILNSPTSRFTCARIRSRFMDVTLPTSLLRPLISSPTGFVPRHRSSEDFLNRYRPPILDFGIVPKRKYR